jgi:hypothetical protein
VRMCSCGGTVESSSSDSPSPDSAEKRLTSAVMSPCDATAARSRTAARCAGGGLTSGGIPSGTVGGRGTKGRMAAVLGATVAAAAAAGRTPGGRRAIAATAASVARSAACAARSAVCAATSCWRRAAREVKVTGGSGGCSATPAGTLSPGAAAAPTSGAAAASLFGGALLSGRGSPPAGDELEGDGMDSSSFTSSPSAASARMLGWTRPVRKRADAAELPRLRKCGGQVWMEGLVVQHSKQMRGVLVQMRSMGLTLHKAQRTIVSEGGWSDG